ncbi:IS66 family transposase [Crenobacter caeni]|uniref:Transposase n=1 Tax=Crenobacter caeni TaxID=2705474 RepID=A0A6B2KUW7_9NEIS|nr:transposase [Crenobacter caeni]
MDRPHRGCAAAPGSGKGKIKCAYLWAYYRSNDLAGGPPMVVFDYQASRGGQHVRDFLRNDLAF